METITLYIIKVLLFVSLYAVLSRLVKNRLLKKRKNISIFDAEVVFLAGIIAAIITMAVAKILKKIIL